MTPENKALFLKVLEVILRECKVEMGEKLGGKIEKGGIRDVRETEVGQGLILVVNDDKTSQGFYVTKTSVAQKNEQSKP
jgi:hypothetical protein